MKMKKQIKITLMQEEIDSILNLNEVCIFEDDDKEIFISLDDNEENILRRDILDRYDNSEYHNYDILQE